MAILDAVSLAILLGSALTLAGILSSLVALRFGAPLLLVFLAVGMLAGEAGPGGVKFDDVRTTYLVGSIAHAAGDISQRPCPFAFAGNGRRLADGGVRRAVCEIFARDRLDGIAAGWCCGGLYRRCSSVLPPACKGPAAAAARCRDA